MLPVKGFTGIRSGGGSRGGNHHPKPSRPEPLISRPTQRSTPVGRGINSVSEEALTGGLGFLAARVELLGQFGGADLPEIERLLTIAQVILHQNGFTAAPDRGEALMAPMVSNLAKLIARGRTVGRGELTTLRTQLLTAAASLTGGQV